MSTSVNSTNSNNPAAIWQPNPETIKNLRLSQFIEIVQEKYNLIFEDYEALHQWSVEQPENFWDSLWDFCEVVANKGQITVRHEKHIIDTEFYPDSEINYAENLLQYANQFANQPAIIFHSEDKLQSSWSWQQVSDAVSQLQQQLQSIGIGKDDRVAGIVANTPETIIAMLATTSLGAVWTTCSPDFGVPAILERFAQISPKCLFATRNYYYNGKCFDCTEKILQVYEQLESSIHAIVINMVPEAVEMDGAVEHNGQYLIEVGKRLNKPISDFHQWIAQKSVKPLMFEAMPFNAPLFIMYSSGTTGAPKCIVHGIGGTLLEHLKEHQLHCDIRPQDRVFYFTTCSWMMWNWQISALATGATLVLFDGSPFAGRPDLLINLIDKQQITLFGTSAAYLDALAKSRCLSIGDRTLPTLRTIAVTGSPLLPEGYEFVYNYLKSDVHLASICGGTDIVGCFLLGNPMLPVYQGEIQCKSLAMAVDVFDEQGNSIALEKGELVCTNACPSMPTGFWDDPENKRYYKAYFTRYPNVWHHGDFIEVTEHKGIIVYGRSDATLNPGGVRIGTAEIYRQVNNMEEIKESVVVGQAFDNSVRVILFVVAEQQLTPALVQKIKQQIKQNCSPRHVPAKILAVEEVPKTRNGKISEIAVKNCISGIAIGNLNSLVNPESLERFKEYYANELAE